MKNPINPLKSNSPLLLVLASPSPLPAPLALVDHVKGLEHDYKWFVPPRPVLGGLELRFLEFDRK
jgi:hypothetical protein